MSSVEAEASASIRRRSERRRFVECGGRGICKHRKVRSGCVECGGPGICEHQKERRRCVECGGTSICEHQKERSKCAECRYNAVADASGIDPAEIVRAEGHDHGPTANGLVWVPAPTDQKLAKGAKK